VIPTGVTVSFNNGSVASPAQSETVNVDSIGSTGKLGMIAGNLNVANNLQLEALTQTGGTLGGTGNISVNTFGQTGGAVVNAGNFTVSQAFAQAAPGTVAVGGSIGITQTSGDLNFNSLSSKDMTLTAGNGGIELGSVTTRSTLNVFARDNISQSLSSVIVADGISVLKSTAGNILLGNATNDFDGITTISGNDITLAADADDAVVLNASGNITLLSGGSLEVNARTNDTAVSAVKIDQALQVFDYGVKTTDNLAVMDENNIVFVNDI